MRFRFAAGVAPRPRPHAARIALPLLLGAGLFWVLLRSGPLPDAAEVAAALAALTPLHWGGALVATAASFAALGHYDAAIHRAIATGIPAGRARRAGRRAVAIAQVAGLGAVSGAFARWRLLPDLGAVRAAQVSALVGVSFFAAWAVITATVLALAAPDLPAGPALTAVALGAACVALALPSAARRHRAVTTLVGTLDHRNLARLTAWALIDTAFAALALSFCLPDGAVPFGTLFAAYLLALGAGMAGGAPVGAGGFDLALLTLLPTVPEADLLAALIAFRLVYYAVPALLSLPALMRPAAKPRLAPAPPAARRDLLADPPCPEWGLARQRAEILAAPGRGAWLSVVAPGLRAAVGRPAGRPDLRDLVAAARAEGRRVALYKAPARLAAHARRTGWCTIRIGTVARIDPARWSPDGPARRQLRRKLRQARAAGVEVTEARTLPLAQMADLSAGWAARNGGEKGLTMGTWDADYVARQQVFLAFDGARLVGFLTLHRAPRSRAVDIMRLAADAAPGTMHALVAAALDQARTDGMTVVSLAAAPSLPAWPAIDRRLPKGLAQFKDAFGPDRRPVYLCTPRPWQAPAALLSLAWAIHAGPRQALANRCCAAWNDAENAFEFSHPACHANGQSISAEHGYSHDRRAFPPSGHQ